MDRTVVVAGTLVLGVAIGVSLLAAVSGTGAFADVGLLDGGDSGLDTFDNESDFRAYVQSDATRLRSGVPSASRGGGDGGDGSARETADASAGEASGGADRRVAETNVQTSGLDEPDLVKTDGRHFYYATPDDRIRSRAVPEQRGETHVVDADDPASPEVVGSVNTSGRLLLVGDSLVVIREDEVVGYDVSAPGDPERTWSRGLNGSVVSARATDDQIYLVVRQDVTASTTCPFRPFGNETVDCESIHHPEERVPVDATVFAFSVAPATGEVDDRVAFVGTRDNSVVYMSEDALYVTYTNPTDRGEVYSRVVESFERTPDRVDRRMRELRSYDLSERAMLTEVERAYRSWVDSLDDEEAERVHENFTDHARSYVRAESRNLTTTGVVRVGVGTEDDLAVESVGTVPGRPLNQFSLDEYDGTLRIATTVPGAGADGNENDLYTLDADSLERQGAVRGMGENQSIFAVRYVEERAYLVTFRRVDPFHVVDVSDPSDPVERGELELPGFSRYLHPVDDDRILGIGREDGRVKAVLFDVSNASNPTIAESKRYDRSWSEIERTHHAFLLDRRHGVFFLPTERDGLVVDYRNDSLELETTVDVEDPTRARYVGDYLYVFGRDEIAVVDETTWERTATVELDG
ncbi:beta-propeller domain-containing protein [Halosimplex salinum]|uniref:beta-propeller domain-containing protein n=1 Tax=Halosimplex salinum TaxID=1710538 RepID=UPI000F487AF6|nr:beta-propeller domain-containing protein [Halosimplex salinum]